MYLWSPTKSIIQGKLKPNHCQHTHTHRHTQRQPLNVAALIFLMPGSPGLVIHLRVAWVSHSFWWGDVHIWRYRFVHEGTEAHTQVTGGFAHFFSQSISQFPKLCQVIIHGVGQVHQVVQIHRVVSHLPHLQSERPRVI